MLDLSGTGFAELLAPAIGSDSEGGLYARFVTSVTLSAIITLSIWLIGKMKFNAQRITVWLIMAGLFMLFFTSFNLSFEFIQSKIWFMVSQGILTTLYISVVSISIASVLAIIGAVAKLSSNGFANGLASFYTSFFRGLPLLMQVYLIYLGLPQLGFVIDAVPAGILALSLCYGAYMTEIFRAGIESIPKGQWEAARSIGFKFGLTMRRIILPQAIPLIIPPTGNQFIAMLKDSSLVSVIGVWELMFLARTLGQKDFKHMEMLITAAMLYWILSMVLEYAQSHIERRYRKG
ncbi:amino acid ABC transporter permease [Aliamphritea spongicola]|nr:amino acid ABC transporter permease [Aliamphritea spongicola]